MKHGSISEILEVPQGLLEGLEKAMGKAGFPSALGKVQEENGALIENALKEAGGDAERAEDVRSALFEQVKAHERELYRYVGISPENFDFAKVAKAARDIGTEEDGFFLKKEYAKEILRKRPPEQTMKYLGYSNVQDLLAKEDVGDLFSALRFTESNEWMHKTFKEAYSGFTPGDFEKRPIELRVLGPQWKEIAEKYVAKKHHNVSHLKEFGIIFLNPIQQTEEGKFLRDFTLLLHYFHEVAFYSKLFMRYAETPAFNEKFISLLRGDVLERKEAKAGEWLLVQRYLWKEDAKDPRLFLPRINPEAMHWRKAQEDLVAFGLKREESQLEFWNDLWAVGGVFPDGSGGRELVSFEMEDNAMGVASASDGEDKTFFYHQREALWNKLFAAYAGGYDKLEEVLLEHMQDGIISFAAQP
ncbi:MAG: hypothetical protein Q8P12_02125 [bacterium]|nr:hypothetical protein [bacterium]